MKALRALLLVLALSVYVNAGNMGSGIVDPPPPTPPASATVAPETSVDNITDRTETGAPDTGLVTEITLNLLQSLLSLI